MSQDSTSRPEEIDNGQEEELCPQCLTGNIPGTHFCRKCGAPLSAHAAIGPFESLFAEGHLYRRASEQPQRLIVLLGMWVIFGFMGIISAAVTVASWGSGERMGILVGFLLLSLSMVILGKTTRNYSRRKLRKDQVND